MIYNIKSCQFCTFSLRIVSLALERLKKKFARAFITSPLHMQCVSFAAYKLGHTPHVQIINWPAHKGTQAMWHIGQKTFQCNLSRFAYHECTWARMYLHFSTSYKDSYKLVIQSISRRIYFQINLVRQLLNPYFVPSGDIFELEYR